MNYFWSFLLPSETTLNFGLFRFHHSHANLKLTIPFDMVFNLSLSLGNIFLGCDKPKLGHTKDIDTKMMKLSKYIYR